MFDPGTPRIFAIPPGCDFSVTFLNGLKNRLSTAPVEAIARVEIYVNTHRTKRRLTQLLQAGPPTLMPQIRVLTDLAQSANIAGHIPAAISPLRRRLELSRAIALLLDKEPDLAPRTAIYDLADSLAGLMDEMHGEGVSVDRVLSLDISSDFSAHWNRSLQFLKVLGPYFADRSEPDAETRQRLVIEHLGRVWAKAPPQHPVLVAGSTGSRGATALFMQAVQNLPQGAVILPGFDFDLPNSVWRAFGDPMVSADHPQAGISKLLASLSSDPAAVQHWTDSQPSNPDRNRLISLALRPAPVTDQWLDEGPKLGNLEGATNQISLIEAPTQRDEALAIALRLRKAAQDGKHATLISPDRNLTRQVTAALQRWNILPDDSAGRPLPLTPPGTFLRLTSALFGRQLTNEALLILLKHPLTHTGGRRGDHLLWTRDLELGHLRGGAPFVDFDDLQRWANNRRDNSDILIWINWLRDCLKPLPDIGVRDLPTVAALHRQCAERLSKGSAPDASEGELWLKESGIEAAQTFADIEQNADAAGDFSPGEYDALLRSVLGRAEVRESITPHPLISIWGTLEARVQGADTVILGGLNEGVWPSMPSPDPWLNRIMRRDAGLLLPERRIGLSAHDFQQAIAAPEVILTRALRLGDAPAVASRWLNRLNNLLLGLGETGKSAVDQMRQRGQVWLDMAAELEKPAQNIDAEPRPSPLIPEHLHPKKLSVTRIKTLIRDPYAIYAQYVLRLRRLDPVRREPDALLRGQAIHTVMEDFVRSTLDGLPDDAKSQLIATAARIFNADVPWPATRRMWLARLARIAGDFVRDEKARRQRGNPMAFEAKGARSMDMPDFTLTATADRIDRLTDGRAVIYDYKTGTVPSKAQVVLFDKQLPLEGAIAQIGGFEGIPALDVAGLEYIGLGSGGKVQAQDLEDDLINETWAGLGRLLSAYRAGKVGYTSRARIEKLTDAGDYDHLARLGEWEDTDPAVAKPVVAKDLS